MAKHIDPAFITYDEFMKNLKDAVKANGGNIQKTAMEFGIPPNSVTSIIKKGNPGYKTFYKWQEAKSK